MRIHRATPDIVPEEPKPEPSGERETVRLTIRGYTADDVTNFEELQDRIDRYVQGEPYRFEQRLPKTITVSVETHEWLKAEAEHCGCTINALVRRILDDKRLAPSPPASDDDQANSNWQAHGGGTVSNKKPMTMTITFSSKPVPTITPGVVSVSGGAGYPRQSPLPELRHQVGSVNDWSSRCGLQKDPVLRYLMEFEFNAGTTLNIEPMYVWTDIFSRGKAARNGQVCYGGDLDEDLYIWLDGDWKKLTYLPGVVKHQLSQTAPYVLKFTCGIRLSTYRYRDAEWEDFHVTVLAP
jgi:hypothetical protein